MQDLGQLAAELVLEREQQEGHRDYARQQEEEEGAGGQLWVAVWGTRLIRSSSPPPAQPSGPPGRKQEMGGVSVSYCPPGAYCECPLFPGASVPTARRDPLPSGPSALFSLHPSLLVSVHMSVRQGTPISHR